MGAQDVHAVFQLIAAEIEKDDAFLHIDAVDLVPLPQPFPRGDVFLQRSVPGGLYAGFHEFDAFPFCLGFTQKSR